MLGGENTQDRLKRYDGFQKSAAARLGVPVKLFPAADYAGVMQAIAAGQLEAAEFGALGFRRHLARLQMRRTGGRSAGEGRHASSTISVMVTRKDSGITSVEQMKGHSLAFADPNSTSGYLIPSATLKNQGIDLADGAYFSRTGFAGGHEQGVVAMLNKQFDACVTWTSGQGEKAEGYSRGNLRTMVDHGMLKMSDVKIIWQSGKIPNGPWAIRTALPADLKREFADFLLDLPKSHRDVYDTLEQGAGVGYVPATMDLYKDIIELREAERRGSRS